MKLGRICSFIDAYTITHTRRNPGYGTLFENENAHFVPKARVIKDENVHFRVKDPGYRNRNVHFAP
jgi:hypothetical protein